MFIPFETTAAVVPGLDFSDSIKNRQYFMREWKAKVR